MATNPEGFSAPKSGESILYELYLRERAGEFKHLKYIRYTADVERKVMGVSDV